MLFLQVGLPKIDIRDHFIDTGTEARERATITGKRYALHTQEWPKNATKYLLQPLCDA